MVQDIVASHPYMTLPGNHEYHYNYTHYKERFLMPYNDAADGANTFYSFDLGPVHWIMFNTEPLTSSSRPMEILTEMNWLRKDLEKANENREIRPWIVFLSHHPLYCAIDYRKPLPGLLGSNKDCIRDY